jgi:EAL domain-containing protein (putative c-di-GMP-specific phosphodiesterase class I)
LSASELGFDLSIDDFGIGFSSYFYLKNLPIKEIKIDKLFIDGLLSNDADGIIIKHIIDLAHSVDCEVIAEGVETEEQIARLKELGCDAIQGFCYSKPLSFVDLVTFIKAQS